MNAEFAVDRKFSLHVFRVEEGLGNACLLLLPDGSAAFVDWGTKDSTTLARAFDAIGAGRIAFVAATHAHADHTLGIPMLLDEAVRRGVPVGRFVYPATSLHKEEAYLTRARERAVQLKIDHSQMTVDEFAGPAGRRQPPWLAWGDGWDVRVLSPAGTDVGRSEVKALWKDVVPGNDTSMVILFRFEGEISCGRGVLTGDATPATLNVARETSRHFPELNLRNDCIVIPHHGAKHSLPSWLLDASDGVILVSGRTDNPHHPARDTLLSAAQRCAASRGQLFCTSYAQACRHAFAASASERDQHLVRPGRCFGDIEVVVSDLLGTRLAGSSDPGHARRRYGFCGATPPTADEGAASPSA